MRDMVKEQDWTAHTVIGYVPLDEKGQPYQPTLGSSYQSRKKPVTVYKSLNKAISYSPVGSASEVRMFTPNETSLS